MRLPFKTNTSPPPPPPKKLSGAILESEKTLGTSHEIEVLVLVLLPAIPAGSLPIFPAIIFMPANFCGTCGENLGQIVSSTRLSTPNYYHKCGTKTAPRLVYGFCCFVLVYNVYFQWQCCVRTWTYNNKTWTCSYSCYANCEPWKK